MKKQYLRIIILSLIIIVQDAISSNPFSEWSRHRPKHYNIKVYGSNNPEYNSVNTVNFLGNGGFLANGLSSIKRLITTRPTLKQYIIQRRAENYYSTERPYQSNHHSSSSSPCRQGSTDCILKHLRNRGLIRNTYKSHYRRPKVLEPDNDPNPAKDVTDDKTNTESQDSLPVYRGKGHYRPDCWSNDGENDQAPPIDYAQYSDVDSTEISATETAHEKRSVFRGRRSANRDSDPCLWQDY